VHPAMSSIRRTAHGVCLLHGLPACELLPLNPQRSLTMRHLLTLGCVIACFCVCGVLSAQEPGHGDCRIHRTVPLIRGRWAAQP